MKRPYFKINNQGMTFIEVLIALVILVTGILGAVAMQASVKKGSFDAMQRSIASALAQDIIERMRGNHSDALSLYARTDYGATLDDIPDPRCNSIANICDTATELATNDRYEWEVSLMGADVIQGSGTAGGLVGGTACISRTGNEVKVVVSWLGRTNISDSKKDESCGTAGNKRRQVIVEAFIN